MKTLTILLTLILFLTLAGTVLADGPPNLQRSVVSNGGGQVTVGDYTLSSTAGQAVAGGVHQGDYTLGSGFWHSPYATGEYRIFLPVVLRNS